MKYTDMLLVMINGYMSTAESRENKSKTYFLSAIYVVSGLGVQNKIRPLLNLMPNC